MGGKAGKTLMEEVRHGVSGTMPACEIADVHVALWNAIEAKDDKRAREHLHQRRCRCSTWRAITACR